MSHGLVALLLVVMSGSGGSDGLTDVHALAIKDWVTAVQGHTPGRRDAATGRIATMTFEQRRDLHEGLGLFLSAIQGKKVVTRFAPEREIADLARRVRVTSGTDAFFKRAAVLHSDTGAQNRLYDATPIQASVSVRSGNPAPPLLSEQRQILDKDGEILGEALSDWNWPFARSLLDLLFPKPADDPFVSVWYHATTAFMLRQGLYADVGAHLVRAAQVLPDDPVMLFDRASYAEIQGLPVIQVLLSDDDVLEMRSRRDGRRSLIRTPATAASTLGLPLADTTNAEAERLYRQALSADAALVEARVRLARLLHERKRYEEAAAELATALAAKPEGKLAYYAHLFAGRAAQALGKMGEAVAHYKDAGALFPGAQSALLAQSQAALLGADLAGAAEPIHRLGQIPLTPAARDDPWWQYHLAAGRDSDTLLRAMWKQAQAF